MGKYRVILGLFAASIFIPLGGCGGEFDSDSDFIPEPPRLLKPVEFLKLEELREFSDFLRAQNEGLAPDAFYSALSQTILSDPALIAVTRDYGPTVIPANQIFPVRSAVAASEKKPWSSWWYPKSDDFLFSETQGRFSSPLGKYDLVRGAFTSNPSPGELDQSGNSQVNRAFRSAARAPGSAAAFERGQFNGNALRWEGLCDAWSIASIAKPEPRRTVTLSTRRGSVTFRVSDLKALLLKTYEAVDEKGLKYYGQRFTGEFTGWIHPDLFPDQFHRFLEVQIFEAKKPFIMDHDAGVEVWNVPVFKANFVMDRIPNDPNAVFVRVWVYSAESPSVSEKEFLGTKEVLREYDYVLRGTRNERGDLVIHSGYWVKGPTGVDSRRDHPDYIIQVPDPAQIARKSWNPEIDVDLVDKILAKSYEN